ncbi:hypothetical protein ABIF57_007522 [Bradyrhizobium diazoefficiens]
MARTASLATDRMAGSAETGINLGRVTWADMVIPPSSTLGNRMVNRRLMSTDDAAMGRDGIGNEIPKNISNVPKLHRCLRKTDKSQPR